MKPSQHQIDQYQTDGLLILRELVAPSEIDRLTQRTADIATGQVDYPEQAIDREPGREDERTLDAVRKISRCAESDDVFREFAHYPKILEAIKGLIGPDIKLFGSQLFMKPPGGIEKPYHQDSAYFTIEPMDLVTCWVALDDVTLDNGCMWYIPGSHREGLRDHSERWDVGERTDKRVPGSALDLDRELAITMPAGSCSFHHSLTLHRSGPNRTPHRRRGLALHYMSARCRWTGPTDKPDYLLVRGRSFTNCV